MRKNIRLNKVPTSIYRVIKKMSPPDFKPNNLQLMRRTTLPYYGIWKSEQFPFDWMYSHSVLLSNSVVTGCKPKVVRFLRVQISDRFRRARTLCFIIPLSQHSLHCDLWTAHRTSRSHQSLHHLLISLEQGCARLIFSDWLDSDSYDNPGDSTPTQLKSQIC